jgi:aryl-alcohol dehydrogenase-like predicted oxidoreductase
MNHYMYSIDPTPKEISQELAQSLRRLGRNLVCLKQSVQIDRAYPWGA